LTFFPNVPIEESLPLNHSQDFPTLAMDSNQNLFVAWKEVSPDLGNDQFSGRIYFSKSMDDGISWMEKIIVDGSVPVRSAQQNPNMIVDDSDNIYIAWMDTRRGNPDIFFSKMHRRDDIFKFVRIYPEKFIDGTFRQFLVPH